MKQEDKEILKKAREKESLLHTPSFIAEYPNALSNELCDKLIQYADTCISMNPSLNRSTVDRGTDVYRRKDWFLFVHNLKDLALPINTALDQCLEQYTDEYMGIFYTNRYSSFYQKLQITPPGGGFHNWHCEHASMDSMERVLAWTFYLNDIERGGETEFLHQRLRIKPEKGKCVLFPASFTHSHRGNPPLADTKYIVTGWFKLSHE